MPVERRWIVPTRWLRRRINAESFYPPRMLRMAYRIDAEALPKADLVVSAGGETQMPNICVTRLMDVPNIFCGSLLRGLGPENFNLVISSYDRDAASPKHMVVLKPSAIDPDALGRPAEIPRYGAERPPEARGPPDRRQCRAVPLHQSRMGAADRFRPRGVEGLGHALARLHLAADAAAGRRQCRRACQGRDASSTASSTIALPARAPCRRSSAPPRSSSAPRIRAPWSRRPCRRGCPWSASPRRPTASPMKSPPIARFLMRNNWCRVLPIAELEPGELRRKRWPRSSRCGRTRSMPLRPS